MTGLLPKRSASGPAAMAVRGSQAQDREQQAHRAEVGAEVSCHGQQERRQADAVGRGQEADPTQRQHQQHLAAGRPTGRLVDGHAPILRGGPFGDRHASRTG
jgi:hypothetical protein